MIVRAGVTAGSAIALIAASTHASRAQDAKIVKTDVQIDALDPGIKLFLREKMAEKNTKFTDDNVVLFLHGATAPSACDFDLPYKDYSWADWMVKRGYVVYMGDYRNYGLSSRETAMDEPPAKNQPVTRSYLALRDIEAMVNYIKTKRGVKKVTLIGWSWGAMMAGYYASLHGENVNKLVLYGPSTISTIIPIWVPAADYRTSASLLNSILVSAHIALLPRPPIRLAGTARFQLTIKTNIGIRASRSSSGKSAWRATRPAPAGIHPA